MLVLKTKVTQESDGSLLYIEVVNATGVYDVTNNPGGFGAPNPARNSLALVFYGNFKREAADVLAGPLPYTPESVTSYTLPLPRHNGVLDYYIFAISIFNPLATPADGDIVYDNQNPAAPFIKKRVAGAWVPILPVNCIGQSTVVQTEKQAFAIPEMTKYRNDLNNLRLVKLQELINNDQDDGDKTDYDRLRDNFDYVDGTLEGATLDFCSGAFSTAQHKIEKLEEFAVANPIS